MPDREQTSPGVRRIQFAAFAAAVISFTCVVIGETAQQFADTLAPTATPTPAAAAFASPPHFNAIDYATTAAIKGATVIIGPCDAQKTGR